MKKQLILLIAILIILLAITELFVYNTRKNNKLVESFNSEYGKYYNQEIVGTTLISLINQAMDYNIKNNIEKEEKTIYFKDNLKDSLQIEVKFLESDKIIKMEDISKKETKNFVKFFATASFKCNKIEYHKKTKQVKKMYFEQI